MPAGPSCSDLSMGADREVREGAIGRLIAESLNTPVAECQDPCALLCRPVLPACNRANNDCGPLMPYILGTWAAAAIIGAWGALLHDWRGPQTAAAAGAAARAA